MVCTKDFIHPYSLFDTESLAVSICAIVGKNGKGKSSLVDLVIRIINNFTAALLGEHFNFAAAEHLHFIDYVYASLAFQINGRIYVLEEKGRKITLTYFKRSIHSGKRFEIIERIPILNGNIRNDRLCLLGKDPRGRRMLKSLFYTLVCNYSLYGFNFREYLDEQTPHERLLCLNKKVSENPEDESHSWLTGIFHKNDGYQTPIVLHPMRSDGKLNVNSENHLANERMAALLFYEDTAGHHPFRDINGLHIKAFRLHPSRSKRYLYGNMLETLGIAKTRNIHKHFKEVYNYVLDFWDSKYHFLEGYQRHYKREACDYIVYKTLKIVPNSKIPQ